MKKQNVGFYESGAAAQKLMTRTLENSRRTWTRSFPKSIAFPDKWTLPDQKPNSTVTVGAVRFGNALPLALIAGPCALESRAHALEMAAALKEIAGRVGIGLVYKTSFDKANRTSAKAKRGIGLDAALPIFAEIRDTLESAGAHRRA